ncbi:hypothetical protein [Microtetraspora niveoalba]|uniref:hypothetical protein n=1 Tax=Microtetraspora niveoalba TaxID=46175 RepID=UPI0008357CA4|nr:hypothetical protein [Microtetraspora niveoalba]
MAKPDTPPTIDFNLDAAIAEATGAPFTFAFKGKPWTLPAMRDLDVWPMLDAAPQGDLAVVQVVLKAAFGDRWEEFRSHPMPRKGLSGLFEAYRKHSDADLGESSASSS